MNRCKPGVAKIPPFASHGADANEIDLAELIYTLWSGRLMILFFTVLFSLVFLTGAFLMPHAWKSEAEITVPDATQLAPLRKQVVVFNLLGAGIKINDEEIFNLFIKRFQQQTFLENYIRTTPGILHQRTGSAALRRELADITEKMKALNMNTLKGGDIRPYPVWALSLTMPSAADAQTFLKGYIARVSESVQQEILTDIRNTIALKMRSEEEALVIEKQKYTMLHNTLIQRLSYSLEIARAAGIKEPIFSNGRFVQDDPDFSVSLGADGIARKLAIVKSITDITTLNADLQAQEYRLKRLKELVVPDVHFIPFTYQLAPSLPLTRQGPGYVLITVLGMLSGGMIACAIILFRHAMIARRPPADSAFVTGMPENIRRG
ncbi:LPS O-antigen length regulator Wzz(fepE) [Enterobacter asburiae]|uniref:LPS O-antigen length regulator Wzz(fepE) n=1 Tax=Enterobacter asburiae TaxID=61645 RepID=UPI003F56BBD8